MSWPRFLAPPRFLLLVKLKSIASFPGGQKRLLQYFESLGTRLVDKQDFQLVDVEDLGSDCTEYDLKCTTEFVALYC